MGDAEQKKNELPVSYHTFIYPFVYDKDKDNGDFCSYVANEVKGNNISCWEVSPKDKEKNSKYVLGYNEYQFFFPKARRIFSADSESGNENELVKHYIYKLKSDAKFEISKTEKEDDSEENQVLSYSVDVKKIALDLFPDLQVGLLTFEMENRNHKDEQSVIAINDLGRRIFVSCISEENGKWVSVLTADELTLSGRIIYNKTEAGYVKINFNDELNQSKAETMEPAVSFLENILFSGKSNNLRSSIHPVLDDRMYVICLMRKDHYTPISHNSHGYLYLDDHKYAEQLYKFIFLERRGSTCHNVDMMREKLEEHVYRRWTDWGTVHGVTEYSFVCVTGEDKDLKIKVINPFLTMYTVMAKLVLLQRAAITRMEQRAQEVGQSLQNTGTEQNTDKIRELWQKYVLFQNTLLIPQATFQEQGVELYEMLTKFLKIREMNAYLEDELKNLFNYAQMEKNEREKEQADNINRKINLLTLIGIVLSVFSLMQDFYASFAIKVFGDDIRFDNLYIKTKGIMYIIAIVLVILWGAIVQKFNVLDEKKTWGRVIISVLFIILIAAALLVGLVAAEYCLSMGGGPVK